MTSDRRQNEAGTAERESPRRVTEQQRAIRHAFENAGRPLSVRELHGLAIERSAGLGVATVYRILRRLIDDGTIAAVIVPGQSDRYELAAVAAKHHHHFRCESCDRVFDVEGCPGGLDRTLPPGFTLAGHELSLWGQCAACSGVM